MTSLRESRSFALALHLLMPGLGHLYWKEFAFGLFVFLIMLLAAALFFLSWLVTLPFWVKVLLLGLPLVFYFFSFFDLARSVSKRQAVLRHSQWVMLVVLVIGLVYQAASPSAPVNFILRNPPAVIRLDTNNLEPWHSRGEFLLVNSLAYTADLAFFDHPVFHDLPQRYDPVRYVGDDGAARCGIVFGLPGETIAVEDGIVAVNGSPEYQSAAGDVRLDGDWPLTFVANNSILVVEMNNRRIDRTTEIPLTRLTGRLTTLF